MSSKYNKTILFLFLTVTVIVAGLFVLQNNEIFTGSAESDDNFSGYAWSENMGWISFNCTNENNCSDSNYGVDLDMEFGDFSGYAWSENVGWIDFAPDGPYPGAPYRGAKYEYEDTGDVRRVTGWAKILTLGDDGWVKLHPDPWLSDWDQRRRLTIDHSDIGQDMAGFPVPVFLNGNAGGNNQDLGSVFDEVGSNSRKIAVAGPDAVEQLYVEVEKWDASEEEAILWVGSDDLDITSGTSTHLYLYYDNAQDDNDEYVAMGVNTTTSEMIWGEDRVLAQHLNEEPDGSSGDIRDSSLEGNHGTSRGGMGASNQTAGRLDGSLQFNGQDEYVEIPDDSSLSITDSITVSLWAKRNGDGSGSNPRLLSKDTTEAWGFLEDTGLVDGDNSLVWRINIGGTLITMDDAIPIPDQWTRYTGSFDGSVVSMYRNGSLVATTSASGSIGTNNKDLHIGGDSRESSYWNGQMDEVRVSETAVSPSFVSVAHSGEEDELLDWGSEEKHNYGVTADIWSGEFSGWAWNKSPHDNVTGVGWISFNCDDSGAGGCSDTDYNVQAHLDTVPEPVDMLSPNWNHANACSQGAKHAFLNWDVDDPDKGAVQEAYRLVVDDSQDVSEPNMVDTGRVEGDAKQYYLSPLDLEYGQSYSWWVRVWDNHEVYSSLKQYSTDPDTDNDDGEVHTFTVYEHEFPDPEFYHIPQSVSLGEDVEFTSTSTRYTATDPDDPTDCSTDTCFYDWTVPQGAILKEGDPDASSTIVLEFTEETSYSVGLQVSDTEGYGCSTSTNIEIKQSLPTWKEIKVE